MPVSKAGAATRAFVAVLLLLARSYELVLQVNRDSSPEVGKTKIPVAQKSQPGMIPGIPTSEKISVAAKRKLHDSCERDHILACTFPKSMCPDTRLSCMSTQVDLLVGLAASPQACAPFPAPAEGWPAGGQAVIKIFL
jgi:hypothetical protein